MSDQEITYLMSWKDGFRYSNVSSEDAKAIWPELTFRFLEAHLRFRMSSAVSITQKNVRFGGAENPDAIGQPLNVWCKYIKDVAII